MAAVCSSSCQAWAPCMGLGVSGGNINTLFIAGKIIGGLLGDPLAF